MTTPATPEDQPPRFKIADLKADPKLEAAVNEAIERMAKNIAEKQEALTESQLQDVILGLILSGDFVRVVNPTHGYPSGYSYLPFRELEAAQRRIPSREPSPGLLMSMAIRYDHGLGAPGYYDQPLFELSGITHQQRLESALRTMRQLYDEVAGFGFYKPEKEAEYAAMIPTKGEA